MVAVCEISSRYMSMTPITVHIITRSSVKSSCYSVFICCLCVHLQWWQHRESGQQGMKCYSSLIGYVLIFTIYSLYVCKALLQCNSRTTFLLLPLA